MSSFGGFEPRTSPAERRALFDLSRITTDLADAIDRINEKIFVIVQQLEELVTSYSSVWNYNSSGAVPPGAGNITANDGAVPTELYVSYEDANGVNRSLEMSQVRIGDVIWLRGTDAEDYEQFNVTSVTPMSSYYTFGVDQVQVSGTTNQNVLITVNFLVRSVGYVHYDWAGQDTSVDPGTGNIAVSGTGSNLREFALSKIDADGITRGVLRLHAGLAIVITDDPDALPITGFSEYVMTTDPVDMGTYATFTAERLIGGSSNPPLIGTALRVYL